MKEHPPPISVPFPLNASGIFPIMTITNFSRPCSSSLQRIKLPERELLIPGPDDLNPFQIIRNWKYGQCPHVKCIWGWHRGEKIGLYISLSLQRCSWPTTRKDSLFKFLVICLPAKDSGHKSTPHFFPMKSLNLRTLASWKSTLPHHVEH